MCSIALTTLGEDKDGLAEPVGNECELGKTYRDHRSNTGQLHQRRRDDLLRMVKCLHERKNKVLALVRLSLNLVNRGTCIEYAWAAGDD